MPGHSAWLAEELHTGRDLVDYAQHITLAMLSGHRDLSAGWGNSPSHPLPISAASTSFKEARISGSGLRRAKLGGQGREVDLVFMAESVGADTVLLVMVHPEQADPEDVCGV